MRRAFSSRAALLVAVLTVVAGCSDDAASGPASAAPTAPTTSVEADSTVAADLAALYAGNSALPQERTEADCFAAALQERLDASELAAAGIVGPDGEVVDVLPVFDTATATAWVDAQLSCVGFVESSTRALLTQTRGELDAASYGACLRASLTDAEIRAALVQTLSGGFASPEVATLADAQATCAR